MSDNNLLETLIEEVSLTRQSIDELRKNHQDFAAFVQEKMDTAPFLNPFSPHAYLSFQALRESCDLISQHMNHALIFRTNKPGDQHAVLIHALEQVLIDGMILEFGVYEGNSISLISKKFPQKEIFGFDSFEGLPSEWSGRHVKQGHFGKIQTPTVDDNVKLVKGWFDDTLPPFVEKNKDKPVSFLHIDCDLYSSTKTVFTHLKSNIKEGTIIVFDEYMNYTTWKEHEHKAFMEFCDAEKIRFSYLAFGLQQASVRIESVETL